MSMKLAITTAAVLAALVGPTLADNVGHARKSTARASAYAAASYGDARAVGGASVAVGCGRVGARARGRLPGVADVIRKRRADKRGKDGGSRDRKLHRHAASPFSSVST